MTSDLSQSNSDATVIKAGAWIGEIGRIESAFLGFEDHGMFAFDLLFTFGGTAQGIGGIQLDGLSYDGMGLLRRVTQIVGPLTSCVGREVMVLRDEPSGPIVGMQELIGEKRVVWEAFIR